MSATLQERILQEIPAAARLGFHLLETSEGRARSRVEIEPNTNHLGTFFGGSLYAAGVLTCYAGVRALLEANGLPSHNLVIARGDVDYIAPANGDIEILSEVTDEAVASFLAGVRKNGRGRIRVEARLYDGLKLVTRVRAAYLARSDDHAS